MQATKLFALIALSAVASTVVGAPPISADQQEIRKDSAVQGCRSSNDARCQAGSLSSSARAASLPPSCESCLRCRSRLMECP